MFDVKRVQQDFSEAAQRYDTHAALQQTVLSRLIGKTPSLPSGMLVLDAGCGTGRLAAQLGRTDIIQLDIAQAMCRKAAEQGAPAANARVESLPFRDGMFDVVFSSLVLQWVPDWQSALQEMKRVLKPGGTLAVSTFGPETLHELKDSFAGVDAYEHISAFAVRPENAQSETLTEYYPSLLALMRQLKHIGARNKLLGRRRSLMTRGQFIRVEQRYKERFGKREGLPVTWEILYSVTSI